MPDLDFKGHRVEVRFDRVKRGRWEDLDEAEEGLGGFLLLRWKIHFLDAVFSESKPVPASFAFA